MKGYEMTHFKYHSTMNGYCHVLYTIKNSKGQRLIYCIQKVSGDEYEVLRCSQDGEPSYPITPKDGVTFDLPTGDDSTDREVSQWLTEQGLVA